MTGKEWAERAVTEPEEKWPEAPLHIESKNNGVRVGVPHISNGRLALVYILGELIDEAVADATKDLAAKLEAAAQAREAKS